MKRIFCFLKGHAWNPWTQVREMPYRLRVCPRCLKVETDPPLTPEFVMECMSTLGE